MATEKITGKFLINKLLSAFDFEKGFLYTVKELTLRPGKTIKNYIEGERKIFNPIKFYFIIVALFFIGNYVIDYIPKNYQNSTNFGISAKENQTGFYVLSVQWILITATLFFIFLRKKFNYFEIVTSLLYIVAYFMLLLLGITLLVSVLFIISDFSTTDDNLILFIVMLLMIGLYLFFVLKNLLEISFFKNILFIGLCVISFICAKFSDQFVYPFFVPNSPARVGINFSVETDSTNLAKYKYPYLLVDSIFKNSGAESAGLKIGDKIHKINTERTSMYLFNFQIEKFQPGETVLFEIFRNEKKLHIPITLKHKDSISGFIY